MKNLKKTNVNVEFVICGDLFPVEKISHILGIQPQNMWTKGDNTTERDTSRKRIETVWSIETGYEETLYAEEQIEKIIKIIENKKNDLIYIKENFMVDFVFSIVIKIENTHPPSLHFSKETLSFIKSIEAEIDVPIYIFS